MDSKTLLAMILALVLGVALIRVLAAVDVQDVVTEAFASRHQLHATNSGR